MAGYLFDAWAPGFGFLRDVNLLPDGTFLVADSGCMAPWLECKGSPAVWRVAPPDLTTAPVSSRGGTWTAELDDLELVEALPVVEDHFPSPFDCGFATPYQAELLPAAGLGNGLLARLEAPAGTCPE